MGDERLSVRVTALAALVGPCGALLPSIGGEPPSIRRRAPLDQAQPGIPVTGWGCGGACGKPCGKPLRVVWAVLWKTLWKTSAVVSVTDCHSPIPNPETDALW